MDVLAIESSARKPRSVCRNLFGTPPPPSSSSSSSVPTQNIRLLQQLNEQVMETCSQRYNFDFRKGVPMDGRYEWRRPAEDFSDRRRTTSNANCAVQTEPVAMTTSTATSLPVVTSSTNFRRKRQATITDYFPCKKHMRTHSSFLSTDDDSAK